MRPRLTAIVAATLSNGIGQAGSLPWRLLKEMKYFARVTTREPSSSRPQNVVLMGRKTWDGIPTKYRPLPNRRNLIITRNVAGVELSGATEASAHTSIEDALDSLVGSLGKTRVDEDSFGKIFLIGGSQLYSQTLESTSTTPLVDRILLTRILTPFPDCDTFVHCLPSETDNRGWSLAHHRELVDWVGWDVPEGNVEEKGVEYRFEMWVR